MNSFGPEDGIQYSFLDDSVVELHKFSNHRFVHIRGGAWPNEWLFWGQPIPLFAVDDAATWYAPLDISQHVSSIALTFEREFPNAKQMDDFVHAHPALKLTHRSASAADIPALDTYRARATFSIPEVVRSAFSVIGKTTFGKGFLL
jgi:hypothetical protein